MKEPKRKTKKPTGYAKLSQKEKFIAAAKAAEADEFEDALQRALRKVAKPRHGAS